MGVCGAALGLDFLSGRAPSVFYGQMGGASWLGVVVSALFFGAAMGMLARLARRSGAESPAQLLRRVPGSWLDRPIAALWCAFALTAACMLAAEAGHIAALVLPVHHARAMGAAAALLAGIAMAASGREIQARAGGLLVLLALLFEAWLLLHGGAPDASLLRYEVELRLRDRPAAAVIFALLHGAVCACLCAGMQLRLADGRVRALRQGLYAGAIMLALLAGANAVLQAGKPQLLALRQPFTALASRWGSGGFCLSAALIFGADVLGIAAIAGGFAAAKSPGKRC